MEVLLQSEAQIALIECMKTFVDPYGISGESWANTPETLARVVVKAEWFHLYDMIEMLAKTGMASDEKFIGLPPEQMRAPRFIRRVNDFFVHAEIGWELNEHGDLVSRGDDNFNQALDSAASALTNDGRTTAARHLQNSV